MKTVTITCDICNKVIPEGRGWENDPRKFSVETTCTSQNPMESITLDNKYQYNCFIAEDTCQGCMRFLAQSIADLIKSRRENNS